MCCIRDFVVVFCGYQQTLCKPELGSLSVPNYRKLLQSIFHCIDLNYIIILISNHLNGNKLLSIHYHLDICVINCDNYIIRRLDEYNATS